MSPNVLRHTLHSLEDLRALLRIGNLDVVVLTKENDQFERIDRIKPKTIHKQWLIITDLIRFQVLQIQCINDLPLEVRHQLFHILYSYRSASILAECSIDAFRFS